MNIAIDITPLISGHAARGVGIYTKNLIEALRKYENKHSYSFFTRGEKIPKDAEIVHYPYFDPFFLTLPLKKKVPTVVTVHDLIPLVFPDRFPAGFRGMLKWQIQKAALKKTNRILTVSDCSKKDVEKLVGIVENKIDVVYSAASEGYLHTIDKQALADLKKKYSLPENYFMYVGDVNWNKNIQGMIQAFARFYIKTKGYTLVLIGKSFLDKSLQETKEIYDLINKLGIGNQVIMPGYVSEEDLKGLYALACSSLEPSFYEGFGLPVLESMISGCPVLVADNSSLKEIAGPSIRIDAYDVSSITHGMDVITSLTQKARKKLITEGIAWSHQFSWEKTAAAYLEIFNQKI